MQRIRVGIAALNQTCMDWQGNTGRIRAAIEDARSKGVELLLLPELAMTGYGCEDQFLSEDLLRRALHELVARIAPVCSKMVVCVGLPVLYERALYNAVCVIVDREIVGFVPKQHLANDGVHYEERWFKPWDDDARSFINVPSAFGRHCKSVPFGDYLFEVDGVRFGFELCEDAWVADRPGRRLAQEGVSVILNPSASHFSFGKRKIREQIVCEGSRAFQAAYLYSNLLGNEAGRIIYDGDCLIAVNGKIVARSDRFSLRDHTLVVADIDVGQIRLRYARTASSKQLVSDSNRVIRFHGFRFTPPRQRAVIESDPAGWEHGDRLKEHEFIYSVTLGLFDYLRKGRAKGYVVSLSGGADSTAAAVLVSLMITRCVQELGIDELRVKLPHLADSLHAEGVYSTLLTCVYQGTEFNSPKSLEAARAVTTALGAEFKAWQIDDVLAKERALLETAIGTLDWDRDDVLLQNLQARTRATLFWGIANKKGAIALVSSNRSEAAQGYFTAGGDVSGGLNPIGGVDKRFLLEWLKWMEQDGPAFSGAISALHLVTGRTPSAELRRGGQSDEEDLGGSYDLFDEIETLALEERRSPAEVFEILVATRHESPAVLCNAIRGYYTRWAANQWKREQLPVAFHLDSRNLDPRSWCRFPVLSAAFREELEVLPKEPSGVIQ